ncbi:MAG: hypothetical protein V3V99_11400 [candidate division Zixibacteria bacterium]
MKFNTIYRNSFCVGLVVFFWFAFTALSFGATLQLPQGTDVKLKFAPGIKISSGNMSADVPIICYLAEPIQIGGKTVVEEGAQAMAKVAEVKPAGKGGKGGYIKVEFIEFETKGEYNTVDGSKIKLTGYIDNTGKNKKTLSYLFIFGLFIKGSQGEINTASIYTVKTAGNTILESK